MAFLARGTFYAVAVPLWEGLDEYTHFAYVDHLVTFGKLPSPGEHVSEEISRSLHLAPLPWTLRVLQPPTVTHDQYWDLTPEDRAARQAALKSIPANTRLKPGIEDLYEGKQPPLYYMICAQLLKLVGRAPLPVRVLLLRLFTVVLGSLLIPLTFGIARRVLGSDRPALLATILLASMPVLAMTVGRVANDTGAIVLFSLLVWALLRPNPWDGRGAFLIGLTLGAGLLTKAYFIAAIPVVVCMGTAAIWKKTRHALLVMTSAMLALAISIWWYMRILGAGGPVWADVAPTTRIGATHILNMPWWQAITGALNLHFWYSGWSFLSVRSWIYALFVWIFLFLLLGSLIAMLRKRSALPIAWGIYGTFWLAMMYHALITFISAGIPSSTGSYLYAVVACEAVLLCAGTHQWFGRMWGKAMIVLIGLFLVLEAYATHFVLIPYYTGMIQHRADTTLQVFHLSQAFDLGLTELLARLPSGSGPAWIAFLVSSAGLFLLATVIGYRHSKISTGGS